MDQSRNSNAEDDSEDFMRIAVKDEAAKKPWGTGRESTNKCKSENWRGGFTFPPIAVRMRWMGHPIVSGWLSEDECNGDSRSLRDDNQEERTTTTATSWLGEVLPSHPSR